MDDNALAALQQNPYIEKLAGMLLERALAKQGGMMDGASMAAKLGMLEQFLRNFCRDANGATPSLDEIVVLEPKVFLQKYLRHIVPGASPHDHGKRPGSCGCNQCISYAVRIQLAVYDRCKAHLDPCELLMVNNAALNGAWPLIRPFLNQKEMPFVASGVIGATTNAEGEPSTFVASFNPGVAASQSILLIQKAGYRLGWKPGCLDPSMVFSAGDKETNYEFLRFTLWVAWRDDTLTNTYFGEKWNENQVIDGKAFYCGTECHKEPIDGPLGCANDENVGREAVLLVKIDNVQGASASIVQGSKVKIDFAGRVKPCCNQCALTGGAECTCGQNIVHGH